MIIIIAARRFNKCIMYINLVKTYKNPMRQVLLFPPFYRLRICISERLNSLRKSTEILRLNWIPGLCDSGALAFISIALPRTFSYEGAKHRQKKLPREDQGRIQYIVCESKDFELMTSSHPCLPQSLCTWICPYLN